MCQLPTPPAPRLALDWVLRGVPALCARSADAELGILLLFSFPCGAGKQIHQVLSAWTGAELGISGLESRSCLPGKGGLSAGLCLSGEVCVGVFFWEKRERINSQRD